MKAILFFSILSFGWTFDNKGAVNCNLDRGYNEDYSAIQISQNSKWAESLKKFRNALLAVDKESVKTYFDFPILNPGNDIWLVADMSYATKLNSSKIVPFTEQDFDRHFSSILSIDFRKTLGALDIDKFVKAKVAESQELKIDSLVTSKMVARYSDVRKSITLSLINKNPEFGQFSIDYHFKILPNNDIKFTYVKFNL